MPIALPNSRIRNYVITLLTVALVVFNIIGFILYGKSGEIDAADRWVSHTQQVISTGMNVSDALQSAVIAQRGYLLTSRYSFLEAMHRRLEELEQQQAQLAALTQGSTTQRALLDKLEAAIATKRAHLLAQAEERQRIAGPLPFTIEEQQEGLVRLQRVRQLHREFLAQEQALLQERIAARDRQEVNFFRSFLLSSVLGVLVLIVANGLIFYAAARQRRTESDLLAVRTALEETSERMDLALQGTNDGVFDWKVKEDQLYISPRYESMLGYGEGELPASMWEVKRLLLHPGDLDGTLEKLRKYIDGETPEYRVTYRMRHKDGSWRWILSRAIGQFGADRTAYRLVGAHTDITEMKTLEEELLASNRELEGFTYIASHDLRSPLVNLKGFAGELKRATDTLTPFVRSALKKKPAAANAEDIRYAIEEDIPEALGFIQSSVERMDRLTTAILQLSRIGRRSLQPEWLDMSEVTRRCLGTLQHIISEKQVEVEVQPMPHAWADAVSLEQVLGNILDNALKYLDPARPARIVIGGTKEGAVNRYFVEDNGRGIAKADQQKVFEIFRRAGNNESIPGEGMGMPYVRALLRRHGGDITFTSEPGTGTVFTFTLPNESEEKPSNG